MGNLIGHKVRISYWPVRLNSYQASASKANSLLQALKAAKDKILKLEENLEMAGAPYTPDRILVWKK